MSEPRRLKLMEARDQSLGRPTIMDRALAQRYGADYVQLAAFAIDVDRVRELEERTLSGLEPARGAGALPFAWEVFLTEAELQRQVAHARRDPTPMLEEMCLGILELPRTASGGSSPLGSQLPFAVYTAVERGLLDSSLRACFATWKKPPRELVAAMEQLERTGARAALARHCLEARLEPPLVAPVRDALTALASEP